MEKTCKQRVKEHFKGRMEDLKTLYGAEEQTTEDLGSLNEYGLSLDFVLARTFDNRADYLCYQLSWGGPADEFRLYGNGDLEYWFLDWFDGASIEVLGDDKSIITDIMLAGQSFEDFRENNKLDN